MSLLLTLFNEIIFRPILNMLIVIVNVLPGHDFGLAIIFVTIIIRLILYPLSHKALKSQKQLSHIQPEIKKLQKEFKDDKQKQSAAVMALYKEKGINPFGGCMPFIIQIPIIIGLYRVFLAELTPKTFEQLYSFVSQPLSINTTFFGILDLTIPSIALAILAGLAQFVLSRLTLSKKKEAGLSKEKKGTPSIQDIMGKQMMYVLPIITIFIAMRFPAGLAVYWLVTTLFSIGQQYVINKKIT